MNIQDYNNDLEKMILSIILISPYSMKECTLQPKHFIDPVCRRTYQIFQAFYEKHNTLDMISMSEMAKDSSSFINFCVELMDLYVSKENFQFYCDKQEERYRNHKILENAEKLQKDLISTEEFMDVIKSLENEFSAPIQGYLLPEEEIFDLVTHFDEKLRFRIFKFIEDKVGIVKKTLSVIAARPGVGKTSFALNLMNDLATEYKCIYFNMEMTEKEIYQRLVGISSSIAINRFRNLDDHEKDKMKQFIKPLSKKKIKILNGSKSISSIRKILAKEQRDEHVIAFIDHIGYVKTGKSGQSDTERVGEAVRELQLMTKDLNLTIILLAHINRAGNDKPNINYLKDSGELEQSAHIVMLLHDPNEDVSDMCPFIELIVDKNRSGRRGIIEIEFSKATQIMREKRYG